MLLDLLLQRLALCWAPSKGPAVFCCPQPACFCREFSQL